MSAPEVLTPKQRGEILTAHHRLSRREMVRYWTFSEEDLKRIHQRRRRSNRLGFAVQLCLLRFPGWPLAAGEIPSPNLVRFTATQLGLDVQDVLDYAQR